MNEQTVRDLERNAAGAVVISKGRDMAVRIHHMLMDAQKSGEDHSVQVLSCALDMLCATYVAESCKTDRTFKVAVESMCALLRATATSVKELKP